MNTFQFDMAAARIKATHLRSYFSAALCALKFKEAPGLGTVAVTPSYTVYVDYDAFKQWTPAGQATALIHEVSHNLLNHHKRAEARNVKPGERQLWNIAGDCEINSGMMRDKRLSWPIDPVHPSKWGLPDDKTAEWYFDNLPRCTITIGGNSSDADDDDQQSTPGSNDNDHNGNTNQQGGGGGGTAGVMQGHCGGCAGHSHHEIETAENEDHGLSDFEREMIKRRVAQDIQRHSSSQGNVPAGWQRWAKEVLSPKINYWSHLRNMVRGTVQMVPGLGYRTFMRPRRRPPFDQNVIMPADVKRLPRVGAYIDASGSMSDRMIARACAEVKGALNSLGVGSAVTVYSGDVGVHHKQKAYKTDEIKIVGGGGTDVVAALVEMSEARPKFDLVICITDGYTTWGNTKPNLNLLVVNVGHGPQPSWPCKYVHIPEED